MTEAIIEDKVHQLTEGQAIHQFCLAGNATFTLRSKSSGARFTYKVSKALNKFKPNASDSDPDKWVWFVNLLTGPDNTNSFNCIGRLVKHTMFAWDFVPAAKYRSSKTPSVEGFKFFWNFLDSKLQLHIGLEFFHAGRCGRCGRTLTVPESVQSGFGPECVGKLGE